jgi:hypothetical protein
MLCRLKADGGLPVGNGEYIMRNKITVSLLVVVLSTLVVLSMGCGLFDQPGKTAAEVNREHIRTMQINQQQLMRDIDRTAHIDQPSTLSEMRISK